MFDRPALSCQGLPSIWWFFLHRAQHLLHPELPAPKVEVLPNDLWSFINELWSLMEPAAMGEQRATRTNEKQARRDRIVSAASDLLKSLSYPDITMEHIAHHAHLAKGTLYLYFRTKESIFLALYEHLLGSWCTELETLASQGAAPIEAGAAAQVIASTLTNRPLLIYLHGILHPTLSQNIDFESARAFNQRQQQRMLSLAAAISGRISGLSEQRALIFLIRIQAAVGGLAWAAPPPTSPPTASGQTSLAPFQVDFKEELTAIATRLLR
jgi:AcrR family transcriptional regulator